MERPRVTMQFVLSSRVESLKYAVPQPGICDTVNMPAEML
jgi:hypothetical protein